MGIWRFLSFLTKFPSTSEIWFSWRSLLRDERVEQCKQIPRFSVNKRLSMRTEYRNIGAEAHDPPDYAQMKQTSDMDN